MGNFLVKIFPTRKDGTAQGVAKFKYMELIQPEKDKCLFQDPFVYQFVIGSSFIPLLGYQYCHTKSDELSPGMWESLICRQIFIDRQITQGIDKENVTQIVILGAGYDCRLYRLDCIQKYYDSQGDSEKKTGLTLIEIDQPEVQTLKKQGLKEMSNL